VQPKYDERSSLEAIGYFQKAIEIEPNNARAWAGIARIYLFQAAYGLGDHDTAYLKSKEAATKASKLDDQLADPYEVLGWIGCAFEYQDHLYNARDLFTKAHELAPNSSRMVSSLSLYEGLMGNFDEAIRLSRLAVELDPLNPESHSNYAKILAYANQLPESINSGKKALELSPGLTSRHMAVGMAFLRLGKLDEALMEVEKEADNGYRYYGLALVYHALGNEQESKKAHDFLIENSKQKNWAYQIASIYAYKNDRDKAFEWLDIALKSKDAGILAAKSDYYFKNLHSDPRWPELLKRIGFNE
jgi:serine/threonine-protein kinase